MNLPKFPKDPFPYLRDPASRQLAPDIEDGLYVYVQDVHGIIFIAPDGGHMHPKVLGGGAPAIYAGDLRIEVGAVVDLTNLSGTFQFDEPEGLRDVTLRALILEDNAERRSAMATRLTDRFPFVRLTFFASTTEMIQFLEADPDLGDVAVIGLDNDLELIPGPRGSMLDPGTGVEVAQWLADQAQPLCPVIVHTTNAAAGSQIVEILTEAGWRVERVHPFDDLTWIDVSWFRTVRNSIVRSVRRAGPISSEPASR